MQRNRYFVIKRLCFLYNRFYNLFIFSIPQYSKAVQVELIEYLLKNKFESFFNFHTWQNAQLHLEVIFIKIKFIHLLLIIYLFLG